MTITKVQALGIALALALVGAAAAARGDDLRRSNDTIAATVSVDASPSLTADQGAGRS